MNVVEKLNNEHKDLYKVYADVIRSNGAAETVDMVAAEVAGGRKPDVLLTEHGGLTTVLAWRAE